MIDLCVLPPGIYTAIVIDSILNAASCGHDPACFICTGAAIIFFNVPLNKLRGINIGWGKRRLYACGYYSLVECALLCRVCLIRYAVVH